MSLTPPTLIPNEIRTRGPEYDALKGWCFGPTFYEQQVPRLLASDLPQLAARVWVFSDPAAGAGVVGFGSLALTDLYQRYAGAFFHFYIPLLAVNPGVQSRGYGQAIVEYLVGRAATTVAGSDRRTISEHVFLDVYVANTKARRLYTEKCGFGVLNEEDPWPDPEENNEPYLVMAKNVAIAGV